MFITAKSMTKVDYVFEISWEVCNKVGGIHTVLESLAPTLHSCFDDNLAFIGPDLCTSEFIEDFSVKTDWQEALNAAGLKFRIGRWDIPSKPIAIMVDIHQFYGKKNEIYGMMWDNFQVDSLNSYGDYDDSSMWAYACGKVVETITANCIAPEQNVVLQAHEWQSAMALLCTKKHMPRIATVFTTHATTVGRSICDNGKCLYKYFDQYDGDVMARELNVAAKHTSEKAAALYADCFTTVSETTNAECRLLLGKAANVILPNGFITSEIPSPKHLAVKRSVMRAKILAVAGALCGRRFEEASTLIVSTSGRNDYKPKGYDVYLEALKRLQNEENLKSEIVALIEVPCWVKAPREDLLERLQFKNRPAEALERPFITHELHNFDYDRIVNTIRSLELDKTTLSGNVHVVLVPSYLDGKDGIFNEHYYDMLAACDLTAYPSYYEPWGYTPMESASYRIPTITTNLAGFGCWVEELLGKKTRIEDGVAIIERNDDNYFDSAEELKNIILKFSEKAKTTRNKIGNNAYKIACNADWKLFAANYKKAFLYAINKIS